ncbi:hypothetical protein ACW69H_28455 [Streptomyces sp. SS10]
MIAGRIVDEGFSCPFKDAISLTITQGDRAPAPAGPGRHPQERLPEHRPRTGKYVFMIGLTLFRFGENGKIAELWWQHDQLGLMQRLGRWTSWSSEGGGTAPSCVLRDLPGQG